jgi:hypothetical protein
MRRRKFTDDEFVVAAKTARSMAQLLALLGVSRGGKGAKTMRRAAARTGIELAYERRAPRPTRSYPPVAERLWKKVIVASEHECWPWTGPCSGSRHGMLSLRGRTMQAHRVAYEDRVGPIPEGLCVCHRCNNPRCCNPSHLYLATIAQNTRDAARDGLLQRGESRWNARMTREIVLNVRRLRETGLGPARIARLLGVSQRCVAGIIYDGSWAHVR